MALLDEILLTDLSHTTTEGYKIAPDGDVDIVKGLDNLKLALFRRLNTSKGALLHRPDYGVGVKDFQNSINSRDNQMALAVRIKEQFEQDSRVESMQGLRVTVDDNNPSKITIYIRVKVIGFGEQDLAFTPFGETV